MYLGLDIGTSGVKAILLSETGEVAAQATASLPISRPKPLWSEQNAEDWWTATNTAVARLPTEQKKSVQAIGLAGQMHGATLLDAQGKPLRPAILWNDGRSEAECQTFEARAPTSREITGNIAMPGFTAPKLVWVARHEPEVFARLATVMLPKDYLNFWLTGRRTSDMSDAAGSSWLDVGARAWAPELVESSGLRMEQMPELVEGSDVVGVIQPERAAELGLPEGCAVVAGGADNAVAACGIGALGEGQGFVSLGTSGVLLTGRDGFIPKAESAVHTFCHAIPGAWYQMGVVLAATDSLNWLSGITGAKPADLAGELGETLQAPGPVRFLPYLSGERTPHNDSVLRGAFANLDIASTRADLTKAVMEGVSFALTDCLDALRLTGARLDRVIGIGGGTQSPYWCKVLATALNLPVDRPAAGEFGAALGAARLAICGVTGAAPADVMTPPEIAETIAPEASPSPP